MTGFSVSISGNGNLRQPLTLSCPAHDKKCKGKCKNGMLPECGSRPAIRWLPSMLAEVANHKRLIGLLAAGKARGEL